MRRTLVLALAIAGVSLALPGVALSRRGRAGAGAGEIVYLCGRKSFICAADLNGGHSRRLTRDSGYESPSVSANGRRMVFIDPNGKVYAADANAGHRRVLPMLTAGAGAPRISPDGNKVVWTQSQGGYVIVETVDFDGKHGKTFYAELPQAGFAPHGQYICTGNSATQGTNTINVGPKPEGGPCPKTVAGAGKNLNYATFDWRPAVSPNGAYAADDFMISGPAGIGVALFNAHTATYVRHFAAGSGNDEYPDFTPDSKYLLFDDGTNIYRAPVHGGPARLLISHAIEPSAAQ